MGIRIEDMFTSPGRVVCGCEHDIDYHYVDNEPCSFEPCTRCACHRFEHSKFNSEEASA